MFYSSLNKQQNRAVSPSSSQKHTLGWYLCVLALLRFVQIGKTNNSASSWWSILSNVFLSVEPNIGAKYESMAFCGFHLVNIME